MFRNRDTQKQAAIYKWVISFLYPYRWSYLLVVTLVLISSLIQNSIPMFVQHFIDELLPQRRMNQYFGQLIMLAVVLLAMILINSFKNLALLNIQEKSSRDLQYKMFQHSRTLGFSYFENHPIGETLSLLNSEVGSLQRLYRNTLPAMISWLALSIISVTIMFFIEPLLAASIFPCLLLYYVTGPYFVKQGVIFNKQTADRRVDLGQKIVETISGVTEIRTNNAEKWALERLSAIQRKWGYSFINSQFYNYGRFAVRNFSFYIGFVVIVLLGYNLMNNGNLSTGEMTAFLLYYFDTMKRITGVISLVTEQKIIISQAEKLYDYIQLKPCVEDDPDASPANIASGEIRFDHVSFRYNAASKYILDNFTLNINPGQRVALVGRSGSGKSTIIKLLGRFYDPELGDIYIDNTEVKQFPLKQLRESIGFVFQETYLYGFSIYENILFGRPEATREEVIQAAKKAFAHDFIAALPDGYETEVGERGGKLSGGQKQRISIARLFLKDPQILIIDEGTAALDNESEAIVYQALNSLFKGRTIIMITHRLASVKDYDLIIVMGNGVVAESGTHQELLSKKGIYAAFLGGAMNEVTE